MSSLTSSSSSNPPNKYIKSKQTSANSDSKHSSSSKISPLSLSPSSSSSPAQPIKHHSAHSSSLPIPTPSPSSRSSSSIPQGSQISSIRSSSPSLASEHLRRVASIATLKASRSPTSVSSPTPSPSSSAPNRKGISSRAPSLVSPSNPPLSLSPSSSALAKPSTSQIHVQADSLSPSDLSFQSPTSTAGEPSHPASTSSSNSNLGQNSGGTIKQKTLDNQIQESEQKMKRKSDHDEAPATSASTTFSSSSSDQDQQALGASGSHRRLAASTSTARPQTWFGRFGGGGSSLSGKKPVEEPQVPSQEEAEFRKSLGLQKDDEVDDGQTLRANKRAQKRAQLERVGIDDQSGAAAKVESALVEDSGNQPADTRYSVMEQKTRNGSESERRREYSAGETLSPLKQTPANRASWFWTRAPSNDVLGESSKDSVSENTREPSHEENDLKLSHYQSKEKDDVQVDSASSPIGTSSIASDLSHRSLQSRIDSLRQIAPLYASPLRRLWGGGSATDESETLPNQEEEIQPSITSAVAGHGPESGLSLNSENDSVQPEPEPEKPAENQQSWFWTRRAPGHLSSNLRSSSTSLPPENEVTISPDQTKESNSFSSPQVAHSDSASFSANQGYSYSSYLASWLTWRSGNPALELEPGDSYNSANPGDPQMNSNIETQSQTPAQKIRAEALARPEIFQIESNSLLTPTANDAVLNSATRKGWVAYFSSKSSNRPRSALPIEDTPEVMDLDEDETPSGSGKAGNGTVTPRSAVSGSKDSLSTSVAASNKSIAPRGSLDGLIPSKIKSASQKGKQAPNAPASKSSRSEIPKDPAPPTSRPATPLTNDKSAALAVKQAAASNWDSSNGSGGKPPARRAPNLVLPTFEDTFHSPPRSLPPKAGVLTRTLAAVGSYLLSIPPDAARLRTAPRKRRTSSNTFSLGTVGDDDSVSTVDAMEQQQRLPRAWGVIGEKDRELKRGCENIRKVVVIGVHGWFSQSIFKTVLGEPTGTSLKFATMMASSVRRHFKEADMELNPEAVTVIPLQGDGKVSDRVDRLFSELLSVQKWVQDLASADAIFVAAHSQGAIVSTHLIARLIEQKKIDSKKTKVSLLAMCGIHHGPFAHLKSTVTSSFINYFETAAAKELFEFQSSNAQVSKQYVSSLNVALKAGVKFCYVASVDDQVVPLESALNSSSSHPSILRALYIDGQSFPRTDFLTNLLVFCVKVRNSGIGDHNLLTLLSSSVAGSLYSGLGHSLVYNEPTVYDLSTRYLLETNHPCSNPTTRGDESCPPELRTMPFEAQKWNPYSLPWALRGLLEDQDVRELFEEDVGKLLSDYKNWNPTTKTLKDLQWRLEPMKMVKASHPSNPISQSSSSSSSSSKKLESTPNNSNSKL